MGKVTSTMLTERKGGARLQARKRKGTRNGQHLVFPKIFVGQQFFAAWKGYASGISASWGMSQNRRHSSVVQEYCKIARLLVIGNQFELGLS